MKLIDNLRQRVTEFNELLQSGRLIQSIILENEYVITDMNSEDQLYEQGINRLGVNIMDYAPYSPLTIEIKKEKGQPYNRVTLRDEGDFEQSFYVEADTQQFTIKAALCSHSDCQIIGTPYCRDSIQKRISLRPFINSFDTTTQIASKLLTYARIAHTRQMIMP